MSCEAEALQKPCHGDLCWFSVFPELKCCHTPISPQYEGLMMNLLQFWGWAAWFGATGVKDYGGGVAYEANTETGRVVLAP